MYFIGIFFKLDLYKLFHELYANSRKYYQILTSKHMHVRFRWNPYKIVFNMIYVVKNNINCDSYMHLKFLDIF